MIYPKTQLAITTTEKIIYKKRSTINASNGPPKTITVVQNMVMPYCSLFISKIAYVCFFAFSYKAKLAHNRWFATNL